MDRIKSPQQALYEIFHVLFKWKILSCLAFIVTFAGILVGTFLVTPRWRATTKILVQQNPRLQPVLFEDLVQPGQVNPRMRPSANIVEIMTAREMAQEVVEKFGLDERLRARDQEPEELRDQVKYTLRAIIIGIPKAVLRTLGLIDEEDEEDYLADAIDDFREDWLDIAAADDSDVVAISVWGESPEMATGISRFVTNRTAEKTLELTNDYIANAFAFADGEAPMIAKKLHAAEERLREFMQRHSISELDEEIRIKVARLDRIEADMAQVEIDKRENAERVKELKSHLEEQEDKIIETGFIGGNDLIIEYKTSIADMEADLSSLLADKTENHPDVISLKNRIETSKENLTQDIQKIVSSKTETMSPIYQDLVGQLIAAEIDEFLYSTRWLSFDNIKKKLLASLLVLSDRKTEFVRLSRRVEILEGLYKDFDTQLEQLNILKATAINEVAIRVIDPAHVPASAEADWPKSDVAVVMGFILSLIFSLILPFVFEYWSGSIRFWEIEDLLEKPIAGEVFRG